MKIEVTAQHIKDAKHCPCHCPVSLAFRAATGVGEVCVNRSVAWMYGKRYELPRRVSRFVAAFDNGEPVGPFSFQVPALDGDGESR